MPPMPADATRCGVVAVIGVPDELWGESVKVVVVLKEGQTTSEQDIINFLRHT